jgi:hypothetical protein
MFKNSGLPKIKMIYGLTAVLSGNKSKNANKKALLDINPTALSSGH